MAQLRLVRGGTTYLLPYPQEYSESRVIRAADTVTLNGQIHRDFVAGKGQFYRKVVVAWEGLEASDLQTIKRAWQALRAGDLDWTLTNPRGATLTVRLDLADPNLKVKMTPGVNGGGVIEYEVSLNLVEV